MVNDPKEVAAKRLSDAKRAMKYSFLMRLESAQDVASAVLRPIVNTGRVEPIEDYYRTLDAITPEILRETLKQKLVAGTPTPIEYAGTRPAALLEEDRLIAALPLNVRAGDVTIVPIDRVFE
jgi:zinc protease